MTRQHAAMLLVLLGACSAEEQPRHEPTPELTVKAFYDLRLTARMHGPPDSAQLASMRPYLSTELHGLLEQATENTAQGAGKRALTEGDLFSSLHEGATSFTIGETQTDGAAYVVPVRFVSAKQLPAVNWVDRIRVIEENGAYVIADIEYTNHWSFGAERGLVASLKKNRKARG